MPLVNVVHDSLPYIDLDSTAEERDAAQRLIDLESGALPQDSHPSLPLLRPQQYAPSVELEFERIAHKKPLSAIDTTRYEATEPPATSSHSGKTPPEVLDLWRAALERSSTSQAYLLQRRTNLALLETYGKNGWLVGNSQLEDVLRAIERELVDTKSEIDDTVLQRKSAQDAVGAEIKGLEDVWRKGIGKVLETEVAAETLRREILEMRRGGAT